MGAVFARTEAWLAELEIGPRLVGRIVAVVAQGSVDEDLVGAGVDAERIGTPQHDIGVLADLERSDPVVEAETPMSGTSDVPAAEPAGDPAAPPLVYAQLQEVWPGLFGGLRDLLGGPDSTDGSDSPDQPDT